MALFDLASNHVISYIASTNVSVTNVNLTSLSSICILNVFLLFNRMFAGKLYLPGLLLTLFRPIQCLGEEYSILDDLDYVAGQISSLSIPKVINQ